MKKLFVMLLVLAVAGGQAFAAPKGLTEKVTRQTAAAQSKIKNQQDQILRNMASFRAWVGERELSNNHILQGVIGIMDSYLELADESESAAVALNDKLNKPVVTKSGYKFTLRGFVINHGCEILSDQDNFERFTELLSKKDPASASCENVPTEQPAASSAEVRAEQPAAAAQCSNEEPKTDTAEDYKAKAQAALAKAASSKSKKMAEDLLFEFQRLREGWSSLDSFTENTMMTMYFHAERIMEKHLALKKVDLPLAEALCPLLSITVNTGYGTSSMYNILFNHAVEMNPGLPEAQDMTENYAKWLNHTK